MCSGGVPWAWNWTRRWRLIRALIPLGLMHVEALLDEEVKALAGERYARKEATLRGRRHGTSIRFDRGAGWPAGAGYGCLECAAWRAGRFRFGATRNSVRMAIGERTASQTCRFMGSPAGSYESGRGSDSRSHRIVELDGVSRIRPGKWGETSADAGAGSVGRGRGGDLPGRDKCLPTPRWLWPWASQITGDKRFLGFVETSTENEQVLTPLDPFIDGGPLVGPGHL